MLPSPVDTPKSESKLPLLTEPVPSLPVRLLLEDVLLVDVPPDGLPLLMEPVSSLSRLLLPVDMSPLEPPLPPEEPPLPPEELPLPPLPMPEPSPRLLLLLLLPPLPPPLPPPFPPFPPLLPFPEPVDGLGNTVMLRLKE
jgi:hypothetical protein